MQIRTIVASSLVALALCFATAPSSAANRIVNGDFETCDLSGWSFVPSEHGIQSGVYPVIGIDGCSFVTLDQAVIYQTFEIATGEAFSITFDAALIPIVADLNMENIIDGPCEAEDGVVVGQTAGRVVLEFLHAEPGLQPNQTLSAKMIDFNTGGTYTANTDPAPLGATHARLKVAGCAGIGGAVFDNIVVDAAI